MAINNDIGRDGSPNRPIPGRDGSPNRPNPKDGAFGEHALPKRKILWHGVASWVTNGATFFITVNCVPRGQNQLAFPSAVKALTESLLVRIEKGQWWPRLVLFMPDHLHALIAFSPEQSMEKIVRDWKRYTARYAGIRWQRDFFDHRIRNEESLAEKWNYILQNPVRAALVPTPEAWPYFWINKEEIGIGRNGSDVSPKCPPG